ncbi:hypothetical protein GCM10009675_09290 [Prauserella alba]|uniref:Uncharacterized protein n=1 Tax=Prauserella alba TaxID=176898 RepID=A0ABP4FUB6_9PSEU
MNLETGIYPYGRVGLGRRCGALPGGEHRWSDRRRSVGAREEVIAEMRHGEGDVAAFGRVDEALLHQAVARR